MSGAPHSSFFRSVWRWHFFAGLIAIPFLLLLAITGAIYLFDDEVEAALHPRLLVVAPHGEMRAPSEIIAAAGVRDETIIAYVSPAAPTRSAEIVVEEASARRTLFVDPYRAALLGELHGSWRVTDTVMRLHSLSITGPIGNALIEIIAGWTLILTATGLFLWWPRGAEGGALSLRRGAGARIFWRDLHALCGLFFGALIFFLALTGLPWSGVWGENFHRLVQAAGQGMPAQVWDARPSSNAPEHASHEHHEPPRAWTEGDAPAPQSGRMRMGMPLGMGLAADLVEAQAMPRGYRLEAPRGADGVYTARALPDRAEQQRVLHMDQYSARPLADIGFREYGAVAQAVEWGVSVHTGKQFGLANQLVMLAACVAIVVLCASALMMWLRRRPKGTLGAPRALDARTQRRVGLIIVALALLFPLTAASALAIAALDALLMRRAT